MAARTEMPPAEASGVERDDIRSVRPRQAIGREREFPDVRACREFLTRGPEAGSHPLLVRYDRAVAMRRWLQLDSESALEEAERDGSGSFANELFAAWIALDPRAAVDGLGRVSATLAPKVVEGFFLALMARDPALAAAEKGMARIRNSR